MVRPTVWLRAVGEIIDLVEVAGEATEADALAWITQDVYMGRKAKNLAPPTR